MGETQGEEGRKMRRRRRRGGNTAKNPERKTLGARRGWGTGGRERLGQKETDREKGRLRPKETHSQRGTQGTNREGKEETATGCLQEPRHGDSPKAHQQLAHLRSCGICGVQCTHVYAVYKMEYYSATEMSKTLPFP